MHLPKESAAIAALCACLLLIPLSAAAQAPQPDPEPTASPPNAKVVTKPQNAPTESKWRSVIAEVDVKRDAHAGDWRKGRDVLEVSAKEGARISLPIAPQGEFDFRITFTRHVGSDSIALIFPYGKGQATFEVDAWGEHLAGIQNIDGKSIRDNATRTTDMRLRNGQRYTMTVEVRRGVIRGLLDGKVICTHKTDGTDLSMVDLWAIPKSDHLGLGVWKSAATIHSIEFRGATKPPASTDSSDRKMPAGEKGPLTGKKVLIVIANRDFFYREYADPREELERAGAKVIVAAGKKERCTPHTGSGEGRDGGGVTPDIALADVKASNFDAILFSGGWGASSYQYAFDGRYNDVSYNGDRAIKESVNKVVNDFIKSDKYVAALCNGVSVLAWARVDGKSPLAGKKVCAPVREAAAGIYNGKQAQPSCRWHPEANGAILIPPGSLGRPGTAEDDVMVDGKIITGEDDVSAREMGLKLIQVLTPRK